MNARTDILIAVQENNRWYKNCKRVRKNGGLICKVCPFKREIEQAELFLRKETNNPKES